jgi:hypothetical protein
MLNQDEFSFSAANDANALLRGGPPSLTLRDRIRYVENIDEKIKLPNGNRYEHFEPTGETDLLLGRNLYVFAWAGCTYVAE